ncbi:MAG TPA: TIM-barrel domain-containing protein, partial [Flavitalea sp.]|nr:TIM-barrel domain-containing protein [Flavitalea sp.]
PPKWTMGYMQSHRTLQDDSQMLGIVDSFRSKKIPLDTLIYLGTGFTPRGWNKKQPSFEFNPEVFKHEPREVLSQMHNRNVKVVVHMVPLHRDKLPTLQGNIPARPGEPLDASHLSKYWEPHKALVETGIDGFWPDEGDWFNLFERFKRHQVYYQGALSTKPDTRPWSLHRNGYLGIAKWGGWIWSGDPLSSWKTLEGQIAVGINHSLSLSPFWGSDIGGFGSNEELTGELYARWFQFGAFCSSFRAHGKTWWTRLPWGWGLDSLGPIEDRRYPLLSELKNPAIEPVARKYAELRYQLLPYNYSLTWQARDLGLPMMRALWLHYPDDEKARGTGNEYLWGRDLLIAPVFEKGATSRNVYLPEGDWYDWWTSEKIKGRQTITKEVNLSVMPIYVRAGAIIPVDPIRQYTSQKVDEPTTLKIYSGADGNFTLYDDDGTSQDYLKGKSSIINITFTNNKNMLVLSPENDHKNTNKVKREFNIVFLPENSRQKISYSGEKMEIQLKK